MVTGWFTRLVVIFAVLAVFAFDGISVVAAHFSASDDAQTAAQAARQGLQRAPACASAAVRAAQATLPKGDDARPGVGAHRQRPATVSLKVRRTATSLLLHLISATKGWAVVTEAAPPTRHPDPSASTARRSARSAAAARSVDSPTAGAPSALRR